MLNEEQLNAIADKFFGAITDLDIDTVGAMLAEGAIVGKNGTTTSFKEALPGMAMLRDIIGDFRYEEVQRVIGHNAFVEEHRARSTTPKGFELDAAACVVVRVNDDGLITRMDEYVDTAPLSALAPEA